MATFDMTMTDWKEFLARAQTGSKDRAVGAREVAKRLQNSLAAMKEGRAGHTLRLWLEKSPSDGGPAVEPVCINVVGERLCGLLEATRRQRDSGPGAVA